MHRLLQKEQKEPQERLGTHAHQKKEAGRSETKKNSLVYEKNIRGAWVVYGIEGIKQYYGYTKAQAKQKYIEGCKTIVVC